jgi:hypothetical protein
LPLVDRAIASAQPGQGHGRSAHPRSAHR